MLVSPTTEVDSHSEFYCTGFFFERSGHALTANHCLEGAQVGDVVDAFSPYYKRAFQLRVKVIFNIEGAYKGEILDS